MVWLVTLVIIGLTVDAHVRRLRHLAGSRPFPRPRPARALSPGEVPLALFVVLFGDQAQLRRLGLIFRARREAAAVSAALREASAPSARKVPTPCRGCGRAHAPGSCLRTPPPPSRTPWTRPPATGVVHLAADADGGLRAAWRQLGFEVAPPRPGHVNGDACGHCSPLGVPSVCELAVSYLDSQVARAFGVPDIGMAAERGAGVREMGELLDVFADLHDGPGL